MLISLVKKTIGADRVSRPRSAPIGSLKRPSRDDAYSRQN
nr:hypothetical protein JVH1_1830 [Rhodococcus sp. JVH1]